MRAQGRGSCHTVALPPPGPPVLPGVHRILPRDGGGHVPALGCSSPELTHFSGVHTPPSRKLRARAPLCPLGAEPRGPAVLSAGGGRGWGVCVGRANCLCHTVSSRLPATVGLSSHQAPQLQKHLPAHAHAQVAVALRGHLGLRTRFHGLLCMGL